MNIEKWFDLIYTASENRIVESAITGMGDFNNGETDVLAQSFYSGINCGMLSISNEIKKCVEELSKIKLGMFQIYYIKVKCKYLLEKWINKVIEKCKAEMGVSLKDNNLLSNENIDAYTNISKNEILAMLELSIEIQKQLYWQRFTKVLSDVFRMAFSAFLGALIGGFIINMFF